MFTKTKMAIGKKSDAHDSKESPRFESRLNEYDVGVGNLADPLYRLPNECVTVLINNLEQMRLQRWPNISGGRQIIEWRPLDIKLRPPDN